MKKWMILTLFCLFSLSVIQAQKMKSDEWKITDIETVERVAEENIAEEKVLIIVEEMPKFPGGMKELMKYLINNLKYPETAVENGIQGRVITAFVVKKEGSIDNVRIIRGLDPACDAEAMRVIKAMPKWIPGRQGGKAVNIQYTLPIIFKFTETTED